MDSAVILVSQLLGLVLAAMVAAWVYRDAKALKRRGASVSPLFWAVSVFCY